MLSGKIDHGSNVAAISGDGSCTVYMMENETGRGTMTCYQVLPGIDLVFNDFRMQSCVSEFRTEMDMLGIDYCRQGRIEWNFRHGACLYLGERDLQVGTREKHTGTFGFPLGYYQGITLAVYMEEACRTLSSSLGGLSIDLPGLRESFCHGGRTFIRRADEAIQPIFSQLYNVPGRLKQDYFKVKALELLLFLSTVDVPADGNERPYFPGKRVETVKAIMKFLAENLERRFTVDELSLRFMISPTALKECFKGVYGSPLHAYMRAYRMQAAAELLRQSGDSVATIAAKVGYDNASKFAAAFKAVIGAPPQAYRNFMSEWSEALPDGVDEARTNL
ncbi:MULTISPECIES: AraC family transcriptional regulator [unclassified Paenibacillus]|uniref:AraC family transcriptional regulator n=1 Tax=unclassified Paenibacillus TaxID=185978 RepID=UPI0008385AF6|nr:MULTISPECIES: AraC family transcriptional regulator [unclassified Paenibacillus]NWL89088.1 AraC family transcriptional regulator [Paenibacillus sp. 79R4]